MGSSQSNQESFKEMSKYHLTYFKEMRKELLVRIDINNKYVMQKIITITGTLAIALGTKIAINTNVEVKTDLLPIFVIAILPSIAFIYDILIAKNINSIHKFACCIKYKIEGIDKQYYLWEHYLGQPDKEHKKRCFGLINIINLLLFDMLLIILICSASLFIVYKNFGLEIKNISSVNDIYWEPFCDFIFILYFIYILVLILIMPKYLYSLICTSYDENGEIKNEKNTKEIFKEIKNRLLQVLFNTKDNHQPIIEENKNIPDTTIQQTNPTNKKEKKNKRKKKEDKRKIEKS